MTTNHRHLSFVSSELRKQLYITFFTNPDERLHLREIARRIKVDPSNLSRELKRLEEEGVFESEKQGVQRYYHLNLHYPLYNELKSIVGKTVGVRGALRDLLKGIDSVTRAFIYGSFAKGQERPGSDIDVCLIVKNSGFSEQLLLKEVKQLEGNLGREISYVYFTEKEWKSRERQKDSFVQSIQKGRRIELIDERN